MDLFLCIEHSISNRINSIIMDYRMGTLIKAIKNELIISIATIFNTKEEAINFFTVHHLSGQNGIYMTIEKNIVKTSVFLKKQQISLPEMTDIIETLKNMIAEMVNIYNSKTVIDKLTDSIKNQIQELLIQGFLQTYNYKPMWFAKIVLAVSFVINHILHHYCL